MKIIAPAMYIEYSLIASEIGMCRDQNLASYVQRQLDVMASSFMACSDHVAVSLDLIQD